jgi:hypothetical protein
MVYSLMTRRYPIKLLVSHLPEARMVLMSSGRPSGLDVEEVIDCVPSIPRKSNVGAGRSLWALIPPRRRSRG